VRKSTCFARKINQSVDVARQTACDAPDMRRIQQTHIVKIPRDEVFRAWTDYQEWPRFSHLYSRVTVVARTRNTARLDGVVKVRHGHLVGIDHPRGRNAKRTEQHLLTSPEHVDVTADTEGVISTSTWKFEPIPEGTLVMVDMHAPVHGWTMLVGTIVRSSLQSLLRQELQAFAAYVEARTAVAG
jgi:hypothetical protein